jgi:hypothetical protein
MEYDAGLADNLCQKCEWRESLQLHQQCREAEYMNEAHLPPTAEGWEQVPDWHIYQTHPDTLVPWWMLDNRNGLEGNGDRAEAELI